MYNVSDFDPFIEDKQDHRLVMVGNFISISRFPTRGASFYSHIDLKNVIEISDEVVSVRKRHFWEKI
jgi:hypothetical protein